MGNIRPQTANNEAANKNRDELECAAHQRYIAVIDSPAIDVQRVKSCGELGGSVKRHCCASRQIVFATGVKNALRTCFGTS